MRIPFLAAVFLTALSLPAQEYVPPPTPTPTPTPIPGSQERTIRKLFLDPSDQPPGLAMKKQLFSAEPEAADTQFGACGGTRIGFREWVGENQNATLFRLTDIRFVFADEESADRYLRSSYDYLRDGAEDFENAPVVGESSRAFGSRLKAPGKPDTDTRGFIYVFRERNVVAKLVMYQGTEAGDPMDVWTAARIAQKAQVRMAASLGPP